MSARVAVLQLPGVNCEAESVRALERAGLDRRRCSAGRRPATELRDYHAYVLPGGFSYQDRVRAGALARQGSAARGAGRGGRARQAGARHLQRRAGAGRGRARAGRARRRAGAGAQPYARARPATTRAGCGYASRRRRACSRARSSRARCCRCRWRTARAASSARAGRMAVAGARRPDAAPLRDACGEVASRVPATTRTAPEAAAAAVCNARGNVLAIMPHPERAQRSRPVSRAVVRRRWAADADERGGCPRSWTAVVRRPVPAPRGGVMATPRVGRDPSGVDRADRRRSRGGRRRSPSRAIAWRPGARSLGSRRYARDRDWPGASAGGPRGAACFTSPPSSTTRTRSAARYAAAPPSPGRPTRRARWCWSWIATASGARRPSAGGGTRPGGGGGARRRGVGDDVRSGSRRARTPKSCAVLRDRAPRAAEQPSCRRRLRPAAAPIPLPWITSADAGKRERSMSGVERR